MSAWINAVVAVFIKDWKSELRTRYALNSILLFAVTTMTVMSFAIGTFSISPDIQAALFWIVLFFSAMSGLAQTFIKEEETRTVYALRLSAVPTVVYIGKMFFNLVLIGILDLILIPLSVILMNMQVGNWILFLTGLALGSIGLAGASTILAAIISKASMKGALFTVLAFPVLLPLLVTGVKLTRMSLEGALFREASDEVSILFSYAGIMITISVLLFEFVWSE